ncbi:MAG TPA: AraC family transcriptional regulator [Saprospiraceae bacterium]|jgi:AraC-like DNA-binding protein|nr:AraC family transcriptional regulator [Saprospiraceae bacterium]HMR88279.1 AraC family transcriptional regulator [Saprospiraceae bacterium]
MLLSDKFYSGRKLQTLVENQTSYTLNNAAMHIFETHQTADRILLQFDQPVLASMLQGKKVMHLRSKQAFDFLPGESLILPSDEVMCIDFPEANMDSPTKCMAMAISEDKIREVIMIMNETMPRSENQEWCFMDYNFHFTNDTGIYHILQRLLFLFTENHPAKDLFVDFMLKELIIRIMQAESKKIYTDQALHMNTSNRLAYVVNYIRKNLQQNLNVQDLSQKAYMSESNFHKVFKNELGISPVEFINNERIKLASSLLQDPNIKIKEVYMECGFESRSYFNRLFKRKKNISPKEFKDSVQN